MRDGHRRGNSLDDTDCFCTNLQVPAPSLDSRSIHYRKEEAAMRKFLLTTAMGGLLFLVPLVFIVVVLGKAYTIMSVVAGPLARYLPGQSIAGIGLINILAVLIMLLVCVLAGLIAQSAPARSFYRKLDGVLLELVPGYAWTKTVVRNVGGEVDTEQFKPVLVTLDDQMQIGFEMERGLPDLVVVFFPGAPDVHSGAVAYVTADRVQPLDTSLLGVNRIMKHMGRGAAQLLPHQHQA
jgi:uncharacterized membrane protein